MNDLSKSRLATNEKTFREANEKAEHIMRNIYDPEDKTYFICECSNTDCLERIPLTGKVFNDLHASKRLFIIKPGHETIEIEKVTEKTKNYWIVEKFVEPE